MHAHDPMPARTPNEQRVMLQSPVWTWPLAAGVAACLTTRRGGVSQPPWDSLNLGGACGDNPLAVQANRHMVAQATGVRPVWLRQVHGVGVVRLAADAASPAEPADAAWTTDPGVACCVLVADCLPVLLCTRDGRAVAAAHAGWRGLAAGVLEALLANMHLHAGVEAGDLQAWLGPCIGPRQFEVGADVLQAFNTTADAAAAACFAPRPRADGLARWLADLPALARLRLRRAGVVQTSTDGRCTVEQASAFFSFRREGTTGRQAAAIWRHSHRVGCA